MNSDLINHAESSQSPLDARSWIDVDPIRPKLRDKQSTRLVNQIHSDYLDLWKIFSQ